MNSYDSLDTSSGYTPPEGFQSSLQTPTMPDTAMPDVQPTWKIPHSDSLALQNTSARLTRLQSGLPS
jgi:hypothetical protein